MERSARMSDASPRTVVLPAPIVPVMMSNDSVTTPMLFNHAMASDIGRWGNTQTDPPPNFVLKRALLVRYNIPVKQCASPFRETPLQLKILHPWRLPCLHFAPRTARPCVRALKGQPFLAVRPFPAQQSGRERNSL